MMRDLTIGGVEFVVVGDEEFIAAMTTPPPRSEREFFGRLRHNLGWSK